MNSIKNIIYSGISTNSRSILVYGYLAPNNNIGRSTLIEYGEYITKTHEVYTDTLQLIYEDDNFIDKPVDIFRDIISKQ